jgi:hypothetical protein
MTNKALEHFQAPHSLFELQHLLVAYLEQIVWNGENRVVYLGWDLRYAHDISNAHHSPWNSEDNWISGKKLNAPAWGGRHPGWAGRLYIATQRHPGNTSILTSLGYYLERARIHIGAGGGGMGRMPFDQSYIGRYTPQHFFPYNWIVYIYEDDWPSIPLAQALLPEDEPRDTDLTTHHLELYVNNPEDIHELNPYEKSPTRYCPPPAGRVEQQQESTC